MVSRQLEGPNRAVRPTRCSPPASDVVITHSQAVTTSWHSWSRKSWLEAEFMTGATPRKDDSASQSVSRVGVDLLSRKRGISVSSFHGVPTGDVAPHNELQLLNKGFVDSPIVLIAHTVLANRDTFIINHLEFFHDLLDAAQSFFQRQHYLPRPCSLCNLQDDTCRLILRVAQEREDDWEVGERGVFEDQSLDDSSAIFKTILEDCMTFFSSSPSAKSSTRASKTACLIVGSSEEISLNEFGEIVIVAVWRKSQPKSHNESYFYLLSGSSTFRSASDIEERSSVSSFRSLWRGSLEENCPPRGSCS